MGVVEFTLKSVLDELVIDKFRTIVAGEGMNFQTFEELFGYAGNFLGPFSFQEAAENKTWLVFDEDEERSLFSARHNVVNRSSSLVSKGRAMNQNYPYNIEIR